VYDDTLISDLNYISKTVSARIKRFNDLIFKTYDDARPGLTQDEENELENLKDTWYHDNAIQDAINDKVFSVEMRICKVIFQKRIV
jgi:hypothetical protein